VEEPSREDVQSAVGRMNVKIGGRREIKKLGDHLWPDERVDEITTGYYGGGSGLIVLTDRRLFFIKDGWVSKSHEDFPLDKVSSVSFSSGLMLGGITVFASGNKAEIKNVNKDDGKRIVDNMRSRLSGPTKAAAAASSGAAPAPDPVEQLKKLGELHDAGVVTDEEFESKKRDLLSRM
jgi:hypothetical protein